MPGTAVEPLEDSVSVHLWNRCGGTINWDTIDILAEIDGIPDMDIVVLQLLEIEQFHRDMADVKRS